jgi:predicted nucleotidyltransferase
MSLSLDIDRQQIADFCQRWRIRELALFGSVLRPDFSPASDVDVLVTFSDDAPWSLWEFTTMRDELAALFGRDVDLVEKRAIKNPFRRRRILSGCEVIHAA